MTSTTDLTSHIKFDTLSYAKLFYTFCIHIGISPMDGTRSELHEGGHGIDGAYPERGANIC